MISIIIPVRNEAAIIEEAIARALALPGLHEVIVVDNGSRDHSRQLATRWTTTIESAPGRGPAMNAGAAQAKGDILLFLHADTTLPTDSLAAVERALEDSRVAGGCFRVRFDGTGWQSRVVEGLYRGLSALGLFYGDAGVFVRRSTFESLGGYQPLPMMEDFEFCLRLRRAGRTVRLPQAVVSSSRRWERQGFTRTILVYLAIQGLYLLGCRSPRLFGLYLNVR